MASKLQPEEIFTFLSEFEDYLRQSGFTEKSLAVYKSTAYCFLDFLHRAGHSLSDAAARKEFINSHKIKPSSSRSLISIINKFFDFLRVRVGGGSSPLDETKKQTVPPGKIINLSEKKDAISSEQLLESWRSRRERGFLQAEIRKLKEGNRRKDDAMQEVVDAWEMSSIYHIPMTQATELSLINKLKSMIRFEGPTFLPEASGGKNVRKLFKSAEGTK